MMLRVVWLPGGTPNDYVPFYFAQRTALKDAAPLYRDAPEVRNCIIPLSLGGLANAPAKGESWGLSAKRSNYRQIRLKLNFLVIGESIPGPFDTG
jgi:hypothetical protein